MRPWLSVIFPAQDEAQRLPRTLAALAATPELADAEVIVVDDGSTDATAAIARAHGAQVIRVEGRRGVGLAVRAGMRAAHGERVLLCDADGAVPFAQAARLLEALDHGFDIAAGSRRLGAVVVPQPLHRIVMGKVWGQLVRALTPTGIADTQCGFKAFSHRATTELFFGLRSTSFAFHVEVLQRARTAGFRVAEVPVDWSDVPGSKIKVGRDSARMFAELLRLSRVSVRRPAAGRFATHSNAIATLEVSHELQPRRRRSP